MALRRRDRANWLKVSSRTRRIVGYRLTDEAIYRDVPGARIPGGSEDVLLDLSVRQLVKVYRAEEKKLGRSKI